MLIGELDQINLFFQVPDRCWWAISAAYDIAWAAGIQVAPRIRCGRIDHEVVSSLNKVFKSDWRESSGG